MNQKKTEDALRGCLRHVADALRSMADEPDETEEAPTPLAPIGPEGLAAMEELLAGPCDRFSLAFEQDYSEDKSEVILAGWRVTRNGKILCRWEPTATEALVMAAKARRS